MIKLIICICTYKRYMNLIDLIESIKASVIKSNVSIEILIIDNYKESELLSILNNKGINNILYYKEENKGLSNARNRAITELRNLSYDYVIFLDDDQIVKEDCIQRFLDMIKHYKNFIVKGNVIYKFENKSNNKLFPLYYPKDETLTGSELSICGMGNTMLSRQAINEGVNFDDTFNTIGGEDTDFFYQLKDRGYKIVKCKEAIVYEEVPKERNTLKYLLKRNFNSGYTYLVIMNKRKKVKRMTRFIFTIIKIIVCIIYILIFNIINRKITIKYLKKIYQYFGELNYLLKSNVKGIY